ncbi:hypothetical protein OH76DRAFT_1362912 [Lentinus brumalis]|uniref:Protein-S-isoprenylcysteine O-methyltransferase n=1 Tax=Lentinus brumalis TaxID=2498619 RepID=A0A371CPY1_9APHY|nr:hypothetical protein OH76DRAFT_1362912 [Polyporus brumalis]
MKAIIIMACGTLFAAAVAPPQPPVKGSQRVYRGQPFEYVVRIITFMALTIVTAAFFCFATSILVTSSPSLHPIYPYLCPAGTHASASITSYSPRFALGAAFICGGSLLRLWAKHTLGSLFTYEVAIVKGHSLVQSGPYAWVRHPGYTGMIIVIAGTHLMHFGSGGYVTECDFASSRVGFLRYVWSTLAAFVVLSLSWRTRAEDAALLMYFGCAWEEYRERVPYALLPGLI